MSKGRKFHQKNKSFAQRRREKSEKKKNPPPYTPARQNYADIVRENKDFEQYYKAQKVCPEAEWTPMIEALRKDLPTAFRITNCNPSEAKVLLSIVESKFFKDLLNDQEISDEEKKVPICLPWYPDRMGWQLQLSRKDIRRSQAYSKLHNFLIMETAGGNISRQEAVSMIPPLLLDVQPQHKVLDMCAAPGSKTAQIIEMLHAQDPSLPEGLVVANDVDNNRCYMLVHQAKRLNSPCAIITNHDASVMPNVMYTGPDGKRVPMKFDRILADVPCTGDGTMRKNPDIWLKWTPSNGNNLHGIQYRIAKRGVEMLAVGGKLVYSTCSLNPLEDEAVIQRLIVETEGAVQVVDVSSQVPDLVYAKGVTNWRPASKDNLDGYANFEEVPEKWQTQIRPQMFSAQDPNHHLERCIRLLPHHQDTGGFFIAVLEKVKPLPSEKQDKEVPAASTNETETPMSIDNIEQPKETSDEFKDTEEPKDISGSSPTQEPPRKKRKHQGFKEDPFVFFTEDEPLWPSIKNFFEMSPKLDVSCLLTRTLVGKKKIIYFTSPTVKDVILNNLENLKIINTGVKTFVRCDNRVMNCAFRLGQEGLTSLKPFIGNKRKVTVSKAELITILNNSTPTNPTDFSMLKPETQQVLKSEEFGVGSCLLELEESEDLKNVLLVGWRGKSSVRAYVSGNDIVHYLRLLGEDVSKFETNKFEKKKPEGEEDADAETNVDENKEANGDIENKEANGNASESAEEQK